MPTRSLAAALHDSEASPLLSRLALHQRIGEYITETLGPLAQDTGCAQTGAIEQSGSAIVLRVATTASAAKLRQTIPRILLHLQQRGLQVTEIRVKVQPAAAQQPISGSDPADGVTLPTESASQSARNPAGARALADTLSRNLPDSPLQRAAERLRDRLAGPKRPPSR
jgi:hypothetical protein